MAAICGFIGLIVGLVYLRGFAVQFGESAPVVLKGIAEYPLTAFTAGLTLEVILLRITLRPMLNHIAYCLDRLISMDAMRSASTLPSDSPNQRELATRLMGLDPNQMDRDKTRLEIERRRGLVGLALRRFGPGVPDVPAVRLEPVQDQQSEKSDAAAHSKKKSC